MNGSSVIGASAVLNDLTDTDVGSPTNGQLLQYVTASSKWQAATVIDTNTALGTSDSVAPSQKAAKTYADTKIPKTDIDTTTTLGTSDTKVPSQKAVKTYADTKAPLAGGIKAWAKWNGRTTGTVTADASYNVTSIVRNSAGNWTITWATDFSSANYVIMIQYGSNESDARASLSVYSQAAGSCVIRCVDANNSAVDIDFVHIMAIGTQV